MSQLLSKDELLREELERYRALCEVVSEAVALHEEGRIIDVNEIFSMMFGYESKEVIGMSMYNFAPPELREEYHKLAQAAVEAPHRLSGLKKDGTIFPVEVVARTAHLKGKEIRVTVVRDLTSQKEAEKALRESERKYRLLMEQAPDGIFIRDRQGNFLDVNEQFCKMTGYGREEVSRLNITDLLKPEVAARSEERWIELKKGKILRGDHVIKRKDGSWLEVEVSLRMIEEVHIQGILRDISERKEAEREIEAARQRYEDLLNAIEGIVWEATVTPPHFTFVSKKVVRILGYAVERWLESVDFWRGLVHLEDRERILAQVNKAIAEHQSFNAEYRVIAADGRVVWLRSQVSVKVENGEVVKLRGVAVDNTERHLAREELLKSHRMLLDSQKIAHWGSFEWELDEYGNIINENIWSDELYRIYGMKPQERRFTHQEFLAFVHPEDRGDVYRRVTGKLRARDSLLSERRIIRPDGQLRHLITQDSVIKDKNGRPVRLVGATHDVTEQKKAEEALKASEQRYRAFIANSSEGIFRYDVEPPMPIHLDKEAQVEYLLQRAIMRECNHAGAEMQGFRNAGEIIGLSLGEIVGRRGVKTANAAQAFVYANYRLLDVETVSPDEGDARRYFRINFIGIVENGKLVRGWGTQREVTNSKRAELAIEAYSEQLRALSARVQAAREDEGTRIAREIHDELGTALTGLRWDLEWIEQKMNESSDTAVAQMVQKKVEATKKLIDGTIGVVRRISSELRPKLLDDLGLIAAIDWYAVQFQKRTNVVCKVDSGLEDIELSREKATAIFRIFQEVLTNVLRHAQASVVNVRIEVDDDEFILEVKDNGKGITEGNKQNANSLGILGMKERAYLIGGEVSVTGQDGRGTTVKVRVPVE